MLFFYFIFFNTLVSPCGILSIYKFCCMPCPLLWMTLPALLPNGTVAELYIRGLSYSIPDTPTFIPPSSETTAVGVIYTINRMLNNSCVTSDGLTDITIDTFSRVQEHEIYKDSRVGLPRGSACSAFLTWWSSSEKKGASRHFNERYVTAKALVFKGEELWKPCCQQTRRRLVLAQSKPSFNELLINK